jgi:hypothetical protein
MFQTEGTPTTITLEWEKVWATKIRIKHRRDTSCTNRGCLTFLVTLGKVTVSPDLKELHSSRPRSRACRPPLVGLRRVTCSEAAPAKMSGTRIGKGEHYELRLDPSLRGTLGVGDTGVADRVEREKRRGKGRRGRTACWAVHTLALSRLRLPVLMPPRDHHMHRDHEDVEAGGQQEETLPTPQRSIGVNPDLSDTQGGAVHTTSCRLPQGAREGIQFILYLHRPGEGEGRLSPRFRKGNRCLIIIPAPRREGAPDAALAFMGTDGNAEGGKTGDRKRGGGVRLGVRAIDMNIGTLPPKFISIIAG